MKKWTRLEKIGQGSFGAVYKGRNDETKQVVAIKVLNLDTAEEDVQDIQREIALLAQLKQGDVQNVTRYHGSYLHGSRLWIIMEYCHGGSVRTLMKSGRIEERVIHVLLREVLLALASIHHAGIIHRDVKAANILVTYDGRVQLCDFGVATQLTANHLKRSTFVGTPYWMAPEVITKGSGYNFKADIWSLGITIYEMATGNPPFADQEGMKAIFLIPRNPPARLEGAYSAGLKDVVAQCLNELPEERPTAEELLRTKYIRSTKAGSTTVLKELVARYDAWVKGGGVRMSLAPGQFMGQEEDADDERVGAHWDFDTLKSDPRPNGDHLTADSILGSTIRARPKTASPASTTSTDHPLLQLFAPTDPSSDDSTRLPPPRASPVAQRDARASKKEGRLAAPSLQIEIPTEEETMRPPPVERSMSTREARRADALDATTPRQQSIPLPNGVVSAPSSPPRHPRTTSPPRRAIPPSPKSTAYIPPAGANGGPSPRAAYRGMRSNSSHVLGSDKASTARRMAKPQHLKVRCPLPVRANHSSRCRSMAPRSLRRQYGRPHSHRVLQDRMRMRCRSWTRPAWPPCLARGRRWRRSGRRCWARWAVRWIWWSMDCGSF